MSFWNLRFIVTALYASSAKVRYMAPFCRNIYSFYNRPNVSRVSSLSRRRRRASSFFKNIYRLLRLSTKNEKTCLSRPVNRIIFSLLLLLLLLFFPDIQQR